MKEVILESEEWKKRETRGQDYKEISSMDWCSTHNLCSEMT